MYCKKKIFENKLVIGYVISKNLSSGARDLQKVKNRLFSALGLLLNLRKYMVCLKSHIFSVFKNSLGAESIRFLDGLLICKTESDLF